MVIQDAIDTLEKERAAVSDRRNAAQTELEAIDQKVAALRAMQPFEQDIEPASLKARIDSLVSA